MGLMNSHEAAKYLGYSECSLRKSRAKGVRGNGTLGGRTPPRYLRVGGKTIRYKKEDLDAWIDSLEVGSAAPADD